MTTSNDRSDGSMYCFPDLKHSLLHFIAAYLFFKNDTARLEHRRRYRFTDSFSGNRRKEHWNCVVGMCVARARHVGEDEN